MVLATLFQQPIFIESKDDFGRWEKKATRE